MDVCVACVHWGLGELTGSQRKHDNLVSVCQRQACHDIQRGSETVILMFGVKVGECEIEGGREL